MQNKRRNQKLRPWNAEYIQYSFGKTSDDDEEVDFRQPLPRKKTHRLPKGIFMYLDNLIVDSLEPGLD